MTREDFLVGLVTLLVTIDPVGLIPAFLSLTRGLDRAARGSIALRAAVVAFAILSFFVLAAIEDALRARPASIADIAVATGLATQDVLGAVSILAKWGAVDLGPDLAD